MTADAIQTAREHLIRRRETRNVTAFEEADG